MVVHPRSCDYANFVGESEVGVYGIRILVPIRDPAKESLSWYFFSFLQVDAFLRLYRGYEA